MGVYQLKVEGMKVEGMLDEISWMVAIAMQSFGASATEARDAFPGIKNSLKSILKRSLHRYEKCGKFFYCDNGVSGKPVTVKGNIRFDSRPPKWPAIKKADWFRYILKPQTNIESMLNDMVDNAAEALNIDILESRHPAGPLRQALEIVIRSGMGKYVYTNEHCGQEETCNGQKELDPWE